MKRSWEASQTARLQAELTARGNTREAWDAICEFNDLGVMQASILASQVDPPLKLVADEEIIEAAHERADEALFVLKELPKFKIKDYNKRA